MLLAQIIDTISIHVLKDSFSQLDKERVVSPCFGKNLHEIEIRCPSRQLIDWWQNIIVQEVCKDGQEVLVKVCTIIAQIALFNHVIVKLDELLRSHDGSRLASNVRDDFVYVFGTDILLKLNTL